MSNLHTQDQTPSPAPSVHPPTEQERLQPHRRGSMPQADEIVHALLRHNPGANEAMIRKAYDYAAAAHAGQMRLSGEPYMMHPASVALTLAQMGFDEHTVAAGLLHDTVEDTAPPLTSWKRNSGNRWRISSTA